MQIFILYVVLSLPGSRFFSRILFLPAYCHANRSKELLIGHYNYPDITTHD